MRRRRNHLLLAVGATTALVLSACSDDPATSPSTSAPATPSTAAADGTDSVDMSGVSLKVAISNEVTISMFIEQSGAFADTPYDIEWVQMSGSNETMEALNAGAVDVVASAQIPAAVLAQANSAEPWTADDAPFKAVAAWESRASKGFVLVVHDDSAINSVADLAGHSVVFAKGAWGQYFWAKASADAGLADGDTEAVTMPAPEGRTAFRSGQVDALIAGYRTGLDLEDEGSARIIASSDEYSPYVVLSLVRQGLLDDPAREAAVADLLERFAAEDQWINDHPEEVAAEFVSTLDLLPATAARSARAEVRTRVAFDERIIAVMQDVADTFVSLGSAKTRPDVAILIDDRFGDGLVHSA